MVYIYAWKSFLYLMWSFESTFGEKPSYAILTVFGGQRQSQALIVWLRSYNMCPTVFHIHDDYDITKAKIARK